MTKPEKPPYGSPECNGCGVCCKMATCPLGEMLFETPEGPCPALTNIGDRFVCGLVTNPAAYAPLRAAAHGADMLARAASFMIGRGFGCDAQAPEEPDNPHYRRYLRSKLDGRKVENAIRLWGINQITYWKTKGVRYGR